MKLPICKKRFLTTLCIPLLSIYSASLYAEPTACKALSKPFDAVYATTYNGMDMEGNRSLKLREDGRYVLTNASKKFGASLTEKSVFKVENERILVEKFDSTSAFLAIKRAYHYQYDWENKTVNLTGSRKASLPLDDYPVDQLSVQLRLRCDLEQGKEEFAYPVVTRKRIKNYLFKVQGRETLNTEIGKLDTVIVERVRKEKDRSTKLWFAPDMNYLLVKLEQFEEKDDTTYQLNIKKASFK